MLKNYHHFSLKRVDTTITYTTWTKHTLCLKLNYISVSIKCTRKLIKKIKWHARRTHALNNCKMWIKSLSSLVFFSYFKNSFSADLIREQKEKTEIHIVSALYKFKIKHIVSVWCERYIVSLCVVIIWIWSALTTWNYLYHKCA